MKRIRLTWLFFSLLLVLTTILNHSTAYAADDAPTGLTAKGAVVIDMKTGQVLFDQNKDAHLYPASITKVMTAILALEKGNLQDMVVTSELARNQEGNRVYLEPGEKEPLEQMLYGLMLNSGNDAAVAIAEHIGGSVEGFAKMMNEKAAELGCKNTHFTNPNGLHDPDHYTSAYDMALIANYAMKNAKFRQIVATKNYEWKGEKWQSNLVNINPMLWNYDGITGVKTGFTDQAQQTMIASAKRGDREIMAVTMGVMLKQTIRLETTQLLDYGFDHFDQMKVANSGDVMTSFSGNGSRVNAVLNQDVYYTYPKGQMPHVEPRVHLAVPAAPFFKGSKVGTVDYVTDGQVIRTVDLVSSADVAAPPTFAHTTNEKKLWYALGIPLLLFAALIVRKIRRSRKFRSIDVTP